MHATADREEAKQRATRSIEGMKHYVAYHSTELMGARYSPGRSFSFHTSKSERFLREAVGGVVWVIVGERIERATRYQLAGRYQLSELDRKGNVWTIAGAGTPLQIDITDLPWFVKEQSLCP
jgi:hypothetical protein